MKKLRLVIGYIPMYSIYGFGHFLSVIGVLYPVYKWCMLASCAIEDWIGTEQTLLWGKFK